MRLGGNARVTRGLRVLTNRMREYFTYGSVGGAGGNPGPYPAADSLSRFSFMVGFIYFIRLVAVPGLPAAAQFFCSACGSARH